MKTIEEFIRQIEGSDALKNEIKAIKDKVGLAEFLKKHGYDASVENLMEYVQSHPEGEISDHDAAAAAGGAPMYGFRVKE